MRIGHFPRHVYLRRPELLQQGRDVGNVLRVDRRLGDRAGPVKTEVHEFELLGVDAAGERGGAGLGLADQPFHPQDVLRVRLAFRLAAEELLYPVPDLPGLLWIDLEEFIEFGDKIGEPQGVVVEDCYVAAGHVSDVDVMALLDQSNQRAAQAKHGLRQKSKVLPRRIKVEFPRRCQQRISMQDDDLLAGLPGQLLQPFAQIDFF